MDIHIVEYGSKEYFEAVKLRYEILRKPLGLQFTEEQLITEADQLHFVGYIGKKPVACAVLQWIAPDIAKMRQVAVREEIQGHGVGKQLTKVFEKEAKKRGALKIKLHARKSAISFYIKLGYVPIDSPFEEIGLIHQLMEKSIIN
jgi:N-acetylglutamate synthase-like GNAT family acetyltransferase